MCERRRAVDRTLTPAALAVLDVARGGLADLDVDSVLDRVLESARELTAARYAAIGVLNESRTGLARFITAGIDDADRHAIGAFPTGRGVLGEMIQRPVPLRVANVGEHPHSYGFPAGHPPMETFLGVPVLVAGEPFGNLYVTEKQDGSEFTHADEEALVLLAEFAGVAIDHARRYSGSETRRGELERTVNSLDAMVQISHAIGARTDLPRILELIAKRGRALIYARALVIELHADGGFEVAAAAGELPDGLLGRRIELKDSVAGAALRTDRNQRLEDELNRARFDEHGLGRLGLTAEAGLVVPLTFHGESFGVLVAVDRLDAGPRFTAEDARMLEAFAVSAATAIATAKSVTADGRRQRLAAAEQERGRWARELHDDTLQNLAALRLGLATARPGGPEALDGAVEDAIGMLESEIASLRGLITDLRPPALDDFGVDIALRSLAERVGNTGLEVELRLDLAYEEGLEPERHTPELETTIYRIVQEALTNATKHGSARRAMVQITETDTTIELTIKDDGAGFDTTDLTAGFGLVGMRERAALLNGTLKIDSTPGDGTVVQAVLPVARRTVLPAPVELERTG
jgi:signal transduction histidine kinase